MNYAQYLETVKKRFKSAVDMPNNMGSETTLLYEEVFKWQWFATKMKIFSFVTYKESVSKDDIQSYLENCRKSTMQSYKGLQRILLTAAANNSVLVTEKASDDAIAYAKSTSRKQGAINLPVIVDLKNKKIHYSTGVIIGGVIYQGFLREFIRTRFGKF